LNGEFWLGLDKIRRLTNHAMNRLRFQLEDFEGNSKYAEYTFFSLESEANKYSLTLGYYEGNERIQILK